MSDRITRLDDATVRQIAAGEVVERPASVAKELVENSVDADADRIDVTVEDGGTERVVVSDDGVGMTEADVRAAVREHTTSKIAGIEDLESGVATLGFRGEALYTIGAVSKLTITTKPRAGAGSSGGEGDQRATELRLAGGEVESVETAGRPEGTTVEVADLFYNTPARRKYLKTTATEFSHVNTVVTRYALANPDVAVSLTHDGREVFATTGRGDLRSALLSVYGREVAESMIAVEDESESASVSGYVSDPETTRSSREYVSTYVNGRYVRSPVVREALLSAYGGQLSADRYPFAVLFLSVEPDEVDVNVHPRKMEVRWGDEAAVRETVETAVEDALLDRGLVRSSAPRGRSAPDEASVEPDRGEAESESDAQARLVDDDPGRVADDADAAEQVTLDRNPERERATARGGETTADRDGAATDSDATATDSAEMATDSTESATGSVETATDATEPATAASSDSATAASSDSATPASLDSATAESPDSATGDSDRSSAGSVAGPAGPATDRKFSAPTESGTLAGGTTDDPAFETLPRMAVLGQLHDTYVVAETPDGLVLVDQHAADERVNYERLRAEFEADATTQMLARPVELELTAGEAAVFEEYREALERLGFRAERADGNSESERSVVVRTAPTVLDETLDPELLRDALGEFVSTDPDDRGDTVEAVADDLLADLACYPSVTGNTSLTEGSVVDLLAALDDCENPYACPHGRPVIIELSESEIAERFERDYPGHEGRRGE